MTEIKIFIIRESIWESLISDGFTFLTMMAIMIIGLLMNSQAIVWIGAGMFFFFALEIWPSRERQVFSVDDARAELDRIEKEIYGET